MPEIVPAASPRRGTRYNARMREKTPTMLIAAALSLVGLARLFGNRPLSITDLGAGSRARLSRWAVMAPTWRRFPLTSLLYFCIFLHAVVLIVGGAYTYARVPFGFQLADLLGIERNPYDKTWAFFQGFVRRWWRANTLIRGAYINGRRMLELPRAVRGIGDQRVLRTDRMVGRRTDRPGRRRIPGYAGYVWDIPVGHAAGADRRHRRPDLPVALARSADRNTYATPSRHKDVSAARAACSDHPDRRALACVGRTSWRPSTFRPAWPTHSSRLPVSARFQVLGEVGEISHPSPPASRCAASPAMCSRSIAAVGIIDGVFERRTRLARQLHGGRHVQARPGVPDPLDQFNLCAEFEPVDILSGTGQRPLILVDRHHAGHAAPRQYGRQHSRARPDISASQGCFRPGAPGNGVSATSATYSPRTGENTP